jgi:hypothetical protein
MKTDKDPDRGATESQMPWGTQQVGLVHLVPSLLLPSSIVLDGVVLDVVGAASHVFHPSGSTSSTVSTR